MDIIITVIETVETIHTVKTIKTIKTTINLEEELWKKFSIKVIQDYGGRKKTDIFEALAEAFVNAPEKTVQEAVSDWVNKPRKKKQK
jgi:hypothetical protein